MKQFLLYCIFISLFISCNSKKTGDKISFQEPPASGLSGHELAVTHCSRCHAFVAPDLLPKGSWKKVLPAMALRMGIYGGGTRPDSLFHGASGPALRRANVYPESPAMAQEDWRKIEAYFAGNAPDSIAAPVRKSKIRPGLRHFKYKETSFSNRPAMTTLVKILPDKRGIVYNDSKGKRNMLTFLTPDLKENYSLPLESTPVQFHEKGSEVYVTMIGKSIFPTDASEGALQRWNKNGSERGYSSGNVAISNLQRPVSMAYGDLDKDGFEDVVACEFGNETGQLTRFRNNGRGGYDKSVLRDKPGAVSAVIKDANKDGLPDIYVLMGQGNEGVYLYENKDSGKFKEKQLLSFLPLNGSQHMELADFNKDGFDDIVYVCGDNADKTPILKSYHGIYIFMNDGKSNFRQSFFYQLNGAYKAVVNDYDLDGDPDIAAVSFFPDYARYLDESFIYLNNKGNLKFEDYTFPEASNGRWMVMDAGDIDSDGDTDLVLGSFVYFTPMGDKTGLGKRWLSESPSVIVLENTVR